jgi:SAM-dependent methyltransferase
MARPPLIEMAMGYMPAQIVYVAAELGLADLLASGPRTSVELAEATGTHAPSLLRLLRALAALDVVAQTGPDRFELTRLGGGLRSDAPNSARNFIRLLGGAEESWKPWGELLWSVRTGERAFDRIMGVPFFDWLAGDGEKAATFNAAMSESTRYTAPGVVASYDLSPFGTVVDVGGGNGTLLAEVLLALPEAQGVLFDLPTALAAAPPVLEDAGVADRCQLVPGDFFESVPAGADAYLMKSVIHDWDDDQARTILRNCREAMAPGGRVLVVERVVPEVVTRDAAELLMIDLNMLIVPGGRERTEAEYRDLFAGAGLALGAVTHPFPPFGDCVLEAVRD